MHVISVRALREFWERHFDCESQMRAWYRDFRSKRFVDLGSVQEKYPSVRYAGNDRYIFKIKGNTYRLIVRINFSGQVAYIRFIGTHAEYDKVDALTV